MIYETLKIALMTSLPCFGALKHSSNINSGSAELWKRLIMVNWKIKISRNHLFGAKANCMNN